MDDGSQHKSDSLRKHFGEALKRARGSRSQAEFARLLGIPSQQTYQRYERGLIPAGDILHRIATRLGVTIDGLLRGGKEHDVMLTVTSEGKPALLPWGFEMEESLQISKAISAFLNVMEPEQMIAVLCEILASEMSDQSKLYWSGMLGSWAQTKLGEEVIELLSPDEKLAWGKLQKSSSKAYASMLKLRETGEPVPTPQAQRATKRRENKKQK
jgi:transcriptional regulator with XRE-family HTH domain